MRVIYSMRVLGRAGNFLTLHDTPPKDEEWSTKIDTIMDPLPLFHSYDCHGWNAPKLCILPESEARAIIKVYCDGGFLIFQKNETYYLLAKVNSEIRQFDILTKSCNQLPSYNNFRQSFFNLKNEKGDLVFNPKGVSASSLYSFLNTPEMRQQFPFQLNLRGVKILDQKDNSLKTLAFRHLLIQAPSLSWLPSLPDELQDKALFYFLNTFISNLYHTDLQSFIHDTLFNKKPSYQPTYREHYSIEEIGKNLGYLRTLYRNGSTKAAMVLASLVYSGIGEYRDHEMDFEYGSYRFFSQSKRQEKEPLFRDLEENREITQNLAHFPNKIVRDLFLLKFFEAKNDGKMVNAQLKQIDLSQAIWLDSRFCSDDTILSCIKLEENSLQQLISDKQAFHHLLITRRLLVAQEIKHNLPEEVLKVKDETGRNILHTLVDYLSNHGICGAAIVMNIFNFVCQRFPEMLAESDNEGRTVYDSIERFKPRNKWNLEVHSRLESAITKYPIGTIKMSFGRS